MAVPQDILDALGRLRSYNSDPVSATNPFGMGNFGHVVNFSKANEDLSVVFNFSSALFEPVVAHLDAIEKAATVADDVAIVSDISDAVNAVAGMAGDITAVLAVGDYITALGPVADDVVIAAQNIAEIQAAPAAASAASDSSDLAMAWAQGHEPAGTGTKSAKEHAEDAASSAEAAATFEPDLYVLKDDVGTAAANDATDFATAAQGGKADTAIQPNDLATVATSGAYADLSGKPALGTAAAQNSTAFATAAQGAKADTAVQPGSLAAVATSGAYSSLSGKPALGDLAAKNKAGIADLDTTGAASAATVLAGSGAWVEKGFKQIATASATGAAVSFTSIPQGYDELLVVFDGVSHDSGTSTTIGLRASTNNGSSYSSALAVTGSVAASAVLSGTMSLARYSKAISAGSAEIGTVGSSPALTGPVAIPVKGDHAGGVNAIQFLPAAGAFDAGTITLYAR
ncbi:MAG: hypothetical protein J0H34_22315 [Rhizobiales bacterium]|nr:hypothetical protein [Hyphomicrobiales bacterium]